MRNEAKAPEVRDGGPQGGLGIEEGKADVGSPPLPGRRLRDANDPALHHNLALRRANRQRDYLPDGERGPLVTADPRPGGGDVHDLPQVRREQVRPKPLLARTRRALS